MSAITGTGGEDSTEVPEGKKIGSGQFGDVFIGTCRGKKVAIKKLHAKQFEEKVLEEFRKEVAIMTHLRHPNVVLFMGACTVPGHLAIVTEFLSNGDVHSVVHNPNNKLSELQILRMGKDVAMGMNWLHLSKPPIIHRDLKPNNLLVDENFRVKVCDFGLSAFQRTRHLQDDGVAPGTPLWMAPEVLLGRPLSEKADVYAFGIVFWEMISREEPFSEHDSYQTFVDAICESRERPPISPDLHPKIAALLEQSWAHDPNLRPSFSKIIDLIDEAMVDSCINDALLSTMWKDNWMGNEKVSWNKFVPAFYKTLGEPLARDRERDTAYKCLKKMLLIGDSEIVEMEQLGLLIKWFGPSKVGNQTILSRIQGTLSMDWFHGDIDRQASESLLSGFIKKRGTFLVRLSMTEPIKKTPFTVSKVSKDGSINHQRVNARSDGRGYYLHVRTKSGNKKAPGGVENLIKAAMKHLHLSHSCPGSKYREIFHASKLDGYLAPPDSDSDSM